MKVAAFIPARGGSQGVPRKNLRTLGGHPLIAFSIGAAKQCPGIQRVIVSTDAQEIADIARAYGAEVPFLRPSALAQDTSTDFDVVQHALAWLRQHEGWEPELLLYCRPTTPLRDPRQLSSAIALLQSRSDATALRSVHPLAEPPQKMMGVERGYLAGLFPHDPRPEYYNLPRQAFPPAYHPNGYVDIIRSRVIREQAVLYGPRVLAFITPVAVEVDREEDLQYLEYLLKTQPQPLQESLACQCR